MILDMNGIIVSFILISGGVACVIVGIKARTFYGVRGIGNITDKQVNPALGRALFCIGGAVLMLAGVWFLVGQLRQ
jgi:hypothetical protein